MEHGEKKVGNLSFHLELDLENEAHSKLLGFLQTSLPGNSKYVALQMLLLAMPKTPEEEESLIVSAVRNRPERNKRAPLGRKKTVATEVATVANATPSVITVVAVETVEAVRENAAGSVIDQTVSGRVTEVGRYEKEVVSLVPESESEPTPSSPEDDDPGVGMLGRNFGKF